MLEAPPEQTDQEALYLTNPIGFTEDILGLTLYDWQADALLHLFSSAFGAEAKRTQVSLRTPNGAGKSERVVAPAALYVPFRFPRGKVVITSKDSKQLNEQVVPAIEKHLGKFERWTSVRSPYYKVTTPTGGSIHAFVTDEGTRFEGWHKEDDYDGPLVMILDEAKTVQTPIFQGIDRCTFNALLVASSPGLMMGDFYDTQTKHRSLYHVVTAGLKDCPHIPRDRIEQVIAKWGEDLPFTRSTIYGEFMEQDDSTQFCVPLSALEQCLQNPPKYHPGLICYFCDFAEGGAQNV